jgi:hypothetical protein
MCVTWLELWAIRARTRVSQRAIVCTRDDESLQSSGFDWTVPALIVFWVEVRLVYSPGLDRSTYALPLSMSSREHS